MGPIPGEAPQIDWPVVEFASQRLIVRWTFYAQWMLSKRKVAVKDLAALIQAKDPSLVDVMVECFAAAVAENYAVNIPAPTPDQWALTISQSGRDTWQRVNMALWEVVKKAQPAAAPPAPQATATAGTAPN